MILIVFAGKRLIRPVAKKGEKVVVGATCSRDRVRYPEKPEQIGSIIPVEGVLGKPAGGGG